MWLVMVGVDVVADVVAGVIDGFPFGPPCAELLEPSEPGLNEGLRLGVSVAAPAVGDPES